MPAQSYNSICDAGLAEVSVLIQQQKVSPVEVVTECLDRIRQLQPTLNAFITHSVGHSDARGQSG
jgi:Asp-tRNA(Asn)/Glu-tRNA(Gln) amidotransferase A subunit family amidase